MLQQTTADFGVTFASLQQNLRSYLRRRTGNKELAEDLLQDVFVKALASERAGHHVDNVTAWLYTVARTTLVDHFRAIGPRTEIIDDHIANIEMDDLLLHQELAACLTPFIEQLAPIYRDTLIAIDLSGETIQSLANKQSVSLSAIKSRASRARFMLKEKVLRCCKVEMIGGIVGAYSRNSPAACCNK